MKRRGLATVVGLLLVSLLTLAGAGVAGADHVEGDPDNHSSPTVLDDEVTPTTEATTTTAAPAVAGDVVSRPLPRTGNDIGGTALFGGALTVLGVALALGARKRRNSFDGV